MATVASASTNVITVVVKESGPRGLDGTAGTDGAGFNNVRRSLLDNAVLWLYKKNRIANVLSGLLTVDRASNGSFIDFHDLVSTETADFPREGGDGWLLERASTNLLLRSEEFNSVAWTKARSSISSNITASPDGALTADKLIEDSTASSTHLTFNPLTIPTGTLTYSVFVKAAERSQVIIGINSGGVNSGLFDLIAGVFLGDVSGSVDDPTIKALSNGWFRISITKTLVGSSGDVSIFLSKDGSGTYSGDGTSGLYLWGAQLEEISFASSYIATVATSETRALETHNFPVLNNVPFLRDGFSILLRLDNYNEQTPSQDIFTMPDATSGTVFKINTTAGGKWEATIKGSDAIDYLATTTIDAVSDLDQFIVVTVSSIGVINIYVDGNVVNGTATVATGINGAVDVDGIVNIALGGDFIINIKGLRFYDFVLNTDEILYLND